jgi:hypothetical protein
MSKIYVASSWRNEFQQEVVKALRDDGHEVYDFREAEVNGHANGFRWSEMDGDWRQWTTRRYLEALQHPLAQKGFANDMNGLRWCEICVYVMPCGPSASMEMGWAKGSGRPVIAYIPAMREPDLMVKMADYCTDDLAEVLSFCKQAVTELSI